MEKFSLENFLLFFLAVFAVYWAVPWRRPRVWLLVAASVSFYYYLSEVLALVVLVSTTFDYLVALAIEASPSPRTRRRLAALSVVANLGVLCYFKYANFFLTSLEQAFRAMGATASLPLLKILAPIGISFYTFEAINYVVDVCAGRVKAERDYANFLLFILFFPHLVAGPIVRARDFLPQIRRPKRWDWERTLLGVGFLLMGLFKKWVIADRMAYYVEPVFADPGSYRLGATWLAFVGYALQIYGDFSGYTDMAIGCAHLLGYKLTRNFNMPYLAANIADFWRRWHISLSSWLRDYLFIPLGGSRGARWRTYRNLMLTMTLGGLWHGASWTFVVWGVLHGLFLIVHRLFQDFCAGRERLRKVLHSAPGTAARIGLTFLCVCVGWVFFRAPSFGAAVSFLRGLVVVHRGLAEPVAAWGLAVTLLVVVLAHLATHLGVWRRAAERLPASALGVLYALVLAVCLVLAPPTSKQFIYFQF